MKGRLHSHRSTSTSPIATHLPLQLAPVLVTFIFASCSSESASLRVTPTEPGSEHGLLEEIHARRSTEVDVLFVVDDSASMAQEQDVLLDQLELMAHELIAPADTNAPSIEDLHLGVVTTSIEDGGVLRTRSDLACSALENDAWIEHSCRHPDDGRDPDDVPIWTDLACRGASGVDGSSIEQPFQAALMALTDQAAPGMPNEGFLREGSLLAIILVTDEDDCSIADPSLLELVDDDTDDLDRVCVNHEELLQPVEHYHDAFVELRGGDLSRILVSAIAGVPVDGSWSPGDSIDELRAMQVAGPSRPSCDTAAGMAFPPVRIAELIYAFGNNGTIDSICRQDWTTALQALTHGCGHCWSPCLSRRLEEPDLTRCRVIEVLSDDRACPHPEEPAGSGRDRRSGWQVDLGTISEPGADGLPRTRRRCEVLTADYDLDWNPDGGEECMALPEDEAICPAPLVDSPCLQGWFFRRTTAECEHGEVLFTNEEILDDRSDARLACIVSDCPTIRQCADAARSAAPCDAGSCEDGAPCVRHLDGEICGWDSSTSQPQECTRCSPTIGTACPAMRDTSPPEILDTPLVGPGGCCAEGFHCGGDRCIPDRTTSCSTGP